MLFRNVADFLSDYTVSHNEGSNADNLRFVTIKLLSRKCLLTANHCVMLVSVISIEFFESIGSSPKTSFYVLLLFLKKWA
jgi:hypothetical protein